jgi:hypothetical protein
MDRVAFLETLSPCKSTQIYNSEDQLRNHTNIKKYYIKIEQKNF